MRADAGDGAAALLECRRHIAAGVPCATGRRPHDLALQMFIESPYVDWRRDAPLVEIRALFGEYVAAGMISLDSPVHETTSRAATGSTSLRAPVICAFEVAVRHSATSVAAALVHLGAEPDLPAVANPNTEDSLANRIWLYCDTQETSHEITSAVTEALLCRRIAASRAASSPPFKPGRARQAIP